jgi:hypothetical protein
VTRGWGDWYKRKAGVAKDDVKDKNACNLILFKHLINFHAVFR